METTKDEDIFTSTSVGGYRYIHYYLDNINNSQWETINDLRTMSKHNILKKHKKEMQKRLISSQQEQLGRKLTSEEMKNLEYVLKGEVFKDIQDEGKEQKAAENKKENKENVVEKMLAASANGTKPYFIDKDKNKSKDLAELLNRMCKMLEGYFGKDNIERLYREYCTYIVKEAGYGNLLLKSYNSNGIELKKELKEINTSEGKIQFIKTFADDNGIPRSLAKFFQLRKEVKAGKWNDNNIQEAVIDMWNGWKIDWVGWAGEAAFKYIVLKGSNNASRDIDKTNAEIKAIVETRNAGGKKYGNETVKRKDATKDMLEFQVEGKLKSDDDIKKEFNITQDLLSSLRGNKRQGKPDAYLDILYPSQNSDNDTEIIKFKYGISIKNYSLKQSNVNGIDVKTANIKLQGGSNLFTFLAREAGLSSTQRYAIYNLLSGRQKNKKRKRTVKQADKMWEEIKNQILILSAVSTVSGIAEQNSKNAFFISIGEKIMPITTFLKQTIVDTPNAYYFKNVQGQGLERKAYYEKNKKIRAKNGDNKKAAIERSEKQEKYIIDLMRNTKFDIAVKYFEKQQVDK